MEVLVHFVFELIKISVLGCIYASLTLVIFILIGRKYPESWFSKVARKKLRLWFLSGLTITIGLFFYMFSYWGNHGLGDGPQIPIGNGEIISNTDWVDNCYLLDGNDGHGNGVDIAKFLVSDNKLCAKFDGETFYDYKNEYFILDLGTKKMREFETEMEYNQFAKTNNLPLSTQLQSFRDNYSDHWHGWRFFLLP